MSNHYFYALALGDEAKNQLASASKKLQEVLPFQRWVHPLDYHVTLAFLGNVEKQKLEESILRISSAWPQQSFPLEISHLGIFGPSSRPRILWAGGPRHSKLDEIRDLVFRSCEEAGFELEQRPFSPHITLARKWAAEEPFFEGKLDIHNPFKEGRIKFPADRVVLYRTHLDKVPKYEEIHSFPFIDS